MRKAISALLAAVCFFVCFSAVYGDTGTYKILDYKVRATPHSDGTVDIIYEQKWKVTGGDIPWVTIGTPNSNFEIVSFGKNVSEATDGSEGDWSGVRLDLDEDYQPGDTFEVECAIKIQSGLFWADEKNYHLDFTPGWYDGCTTDNLEVCITCFAKPEQITPDPKPTKTYGNDLTWSWQNLAEGERKAVSIVFPKEVVPDGIPNAGTNAPEEAPRQDNSDGGPSGLVIFLVIIGIVIVIVIVIALWDYLSGGGDSDDYSGSGGIHYGGGSLHDDDDDSNGGIFGGLGGGSSSRGSSSSDDGDSGGIGLGGGGGFGGVSSGCACACVSCACACACAGGGAAGCARKFDHHCPKCKGGRTGGKVFDFTFDPGSASSAGSDH